jgi:RND superfamily putative drug exporter
MTWTSQRETQDAQSAYTTQPPGPSVAPSGPVGRLAVWICGQFRMVFAVWVIVGIILGSFAPRVFDVLAGAGWQANGSESVQVRELADEHFRGMCAYAIQVVIRSDNLPVSDPAVQRVIDDAGKILETDGRTTEVVPPQPDVTISQDGHTAILMAGAGSSPDNMVRATGELKDPLGKLSTNDIHVYPTGAPALWSDFNESSQHSMIKTQFFSWPVILTIIIIAFGSLVAAGLPLLLITIGLGAAAGILVLLNEVTPVSLWAMNFALILALALGIDYTLFIVARFRDALRRNGNTVGAVTETMDTAGRAVLLSGATMLVSLFAVLLVPVPAFRTMTLGMMLSVIFVLLAALTLLPAVLSRLGDRINALAPPLTGAKRDAYRFERWANRVRHHSARFILISLAILVGLTAPVIGLDARMPSIAVLPADAGARRGHEAIQSALGPGIPAVLQIVVPAADTAAVADAVGRTDGVAAVAPARPSPDGGFSLIQAVPRADPSDPAVGDTLRRLRADLPPQALVGGFAAENIDLQQTLDDHLPLVLALMLSTGFLVLLVALHAPLVALLGTVLSLLSTGAAFGIARLIFQEGHLAGPLGITIQGFLDGWAPVLYFTMIFAISMDYAFFLLSSAKERYDRTGDPAAAVTDSITHSGRVILTAAGVMVAVFFTFALSASLPSKEMGIILGVAVLLDAVLVRLMLLPALLRIAGRTAWWSPSWLQRVLPKRPSRTAKTSATAQPGGAPA